MRKPPQKTQKTTHGKEKRKSRKNSLRAKSHIYGGIIFEKTTTKTNKDNTRERKEKKQKKLIEGQKPPIPRDIF